MNGKTVSDLAANKQAAEQEQEKQRREKREQSGKRWIPVSALIVANLIFISLDIRGYDVVYRLTASHLLASATVIVSGVLALFWWDILYPHSRRHDNKTQIGLSIAGVIMGIGLSLILAFLDYIVGNARVDEATLWAFVIILTGGQAVGLAWWWLADKAIESDAKRQRSLAGRLDLLDDVADLKAEIDSMNTLGEKLAEIRKQFPKRGEAEKAAKAMGYPILARMLADDDGDGTPNYQDKDSRLYQGKLRTAGVMASEAEQVGHPNEKQGQDK